MSDKIGSDILSKKRIRRELDKANQIQIQMKVLEKLGKTRMNSAELLDYIESLGGNYYLILPILKNTGLLKIERVGRHYVYSIKNM